MELRQLRHFLAIVDHGSFSGAALAVGLTQQSLSKSIANLEVDLGVRLFERDTRNVALTSYGEMLLSHARNIDAESHQIRRHIDDILGLRDARLRIGAGLTAAAHIVPAAVSKLLIKRPNLRIQVLDGSSKSLVPMLMRGEVDAIVCVIGTPIDDPVVHEQKLFAEKLRLLARTGHPLDAGRSVPLKRTLDYPWLVGWSPAGLDKGIARAFERARLKPPIPRIETTSFTFVRTVLSSTDHLAVLPEHLFSREIAERLLARILIPTTRDGWERSMSICYRKNSTRSPAMMAFVTEIEKISAEAEPLMGLDAR